jgi:hypothetical protein
LEVVEDRPALLDGVNDRSEVVVGQDHVGGLARHVGARFAHRDTDVGGLERRGVVDAVTGHRHDLVHRLQRLCDEHLVLGDDAREDDLAPDDVLQVLLAHRIEHRPGDHARVGAGDDADLARDGLGGQTVVAGDHDDANPGRVAFGDGADDLRTRRILHRLEAEEREPRLHRRHVLRVLAAGDGPLGDGDDAQCLAGQPVVCVERFGLVGVGDRTDPVGGADVRAQLDGLLGRALHVRDQLAAHVAHNGHALA